jgi:hypothetical protein
MSAPSSLPPTSRPTESGCPSRRRSGTPNQLGMRPTAPQSTPTRKEIEARIGKDPEQRTAGRYAVKEPRSEKDRGDYQRNCVGNDVENLPAARCESAAGDSEPRKRAEPICIEVWPAATIQGCICPANSTASRCRAAASRSSAKESPETTAACACPGNANTVPEGGQQQRAKYERRNHGNNRA